MFRTLRRWWAWLWHRHDYDVIWRQMLEHDPDNTCIRPCILQVKRCTCGKELAQKWTAPWSWEKRRWVKLDHDWMDCYLYERGIELLARHQE